MLYHLLRRKSGQSIQEMYMIKMIKYFFLVETVFLFCLDDDYVNYDFTQLLVCGLILLMYFIGKIRKQQRRQLIFQAQNQNQPRMLQHGFNLKAEIIVISMAMLFFGFFIIYPEIAQNPISNWFQRSVISFQKSPLGFIFNIVGFFFLLTIIFKMVNGIFFLALGRPLIQPRVSFGSGNNNFGSQNQSSEEERKDDDFDDYEEVK